ncbi:uncharacterized protein [Miscanthus floridulus]|uniref:uncharacterized protein n=1 Tax=Miscanthus floridulus TaxID=154761 RepID=UPI00345B0D9C
MKKDPSIMEKIQNFFRGIITSVLKTKKDYEKECEKMSAEEKQKESDKRMEAYKALCLGGLTSMYWKDTTSLLNKVRAISGPFASVLSEGFAISQAGMLIGIAASSFPKSSPWALAAASNGSLFAVLFNIAAFHLEIFEFLPAIVLLISWVLFSIAFAAYWCIGSQDLTIVRLLYKFLSIIVYCVLFMLRHLIFLPFNLCGWALSGISNAIGLVTGAGFSEEALRDRPRQAAINRWYDPLGALRNRHRPPAATLEEENV